MTDTLIAELLRPSDFDGYIGQSHLKMQLNIAIESSLRRHVALDHLLLTGPPGCGKTSLGQIIANKLGTGYFHFESPLTGDDYRAMREAFGVIHIDECHNESKAGQECLRSLTERGYMRPPGMGMLEWEGGGLTVILSTTERGKVIKPLRERCAHQPFFEAYSDEEMGLIAEGMGDRLGVHLDDDDYVALGRASAGTPRRVGWFMLAARDLHEVTGRTPSATEVLEYMRYTPEGLTPNHIEYMKVLKDNSPLGFTGIRQFVDLDDASIRELEQLLQKLGYIIRTKQGRELSSKGFRRIKELMA